MTENMKKFLERISQDEALCEKVGSAGKEELLAMARELGVELTAGDLENKPAELDDDELDAVAGGNQITCACALGGGGTKDKNDKACACVLTGAGFTKKGRDRCVCGFAGYGEDTNSG